MAFPFLKYDEVSQEVRKIVEDRDLKGRNDVVQFYEGFPHGSQDVSFELARRVNRILGAEQAERWEDKELTTVKRGDALDLIAYGVFYVMLLDREVAHRGAPRT